MNKTFIICNFTVIFAYLYLENRSHVLYEKACHYLSDGFFKGVVITDIILYLNDIQSESLSCQSYFCSHICTSCCERLYEHERNRLQLY